jgi:type IV secretory pathway VirJ component
MLFMMKSFSLFLLAVCYFLFIPAKSVAESVYADTCEIKIPIGDISWKSANSKIEISWLNVGNFILKEKSPVSDVPQISNIPFNITREKNPGTGDIIVVIYSGDGGWYKFEQSIAHRLADLGIAVIGIDIKKYLRNRITPEAAASDITDLLRLYGREWKKSRYILLGYSQGAEIVPFIFNRLPEDIKKNVNSLVMLSPDVNTDFEIHISNMIGLGSKQNTFNVIKEISEIRNMRQIIFFGDKEKTNVPDLLKKTDAEILKIPGDHHYNSNTSLIVQLLRDKKAF